MLVTPARRAAAVGTLLGLGFGLIVWETFFAHRLADLWLGPFTSGGVVCVVLAGLIDPDGRIRVGLRALGRTIAYLILVLVAVVLVYAIWFGANYKH